MKNKTFLQSIKCAIVGLKAGFCSEKNFKYYTVLALLFFALNVAFKSSALEFCLFFITAACVFAAEYVNTAIEHLCNMISSEYHEKIKTIKDIGAAAVLACGIGFFAVQGVVLLPKIL